MNKTISIHINQLVFYIDEVAYQKLDAYLDAISRHFLKEDGGDEIVADIEARIAELFEEKLSSRKEVIGLPDVEEMIGIMGMPEEMVEEEASEGDSKEESRRYEERFGERFGFRPGKRLYRDPDEKWIGGVCSGLAAYMGIENPAWIRFAFVLATVLGSWGAWIYLALWIFLPEAKTAGEKLAMRGEPIDIHSIEKTIREEMEDIEERFSKWDAEDAESRFERSVKRFAEFMEKLVMGVLRVLFIIFKVVFSIIAVIMVMAFSMALFALVVGWVVSAPFIRDFFIADASVLGVGGVSLILFIALPILSILYFLVVNRGNARVSKPRWTMIGSMVWVASIIALFWVGSKVAKEFQYEANVSKKQELKGDLGDVLYIDAKTREDGDYARIGGLLHLNGVTFEEGLMEVGGVSMEIVPTDGTEFELEKKVYARGRTYEEANHKAEGIVYDWDSVNDSSVVFGDYFGVSRKDKWRAQKIKMLLKVPKGKSVRLNKEFRKRVPTYFNRDGSDYRAWSTDLWTMTDEGLVRYEDVHPEAKVVESVEGEQQGFTVYVKKPDNWGTPYVYYWDLLPASTPMTTVNWPGVEMKHEGDGWYSFYFKGADKANLIFSNEGREQSEDLSREKDGWYMIEQEEWEDHDPSPLAGKKAYYQAPLRFI